MSFDTSARVNFTIHKTKHPKVFAAIHKWKEQRFVLSDKICQSIEELYERELREVAQPKPISPSLAACLIGNGNGNGKAEQPKKFLTPDQQLEHELLSVESKKNHEKAHQLYHIFEIRKINQLIDNNEMMTNTLRLWYLGHMRKYCIECRRLYLLREDRRMITENTWMTEANQQMWQEAQKRYKEEIYMYSP